MYAIKFEVIIPITVNYLVDLEAFIFLLLSLADKETVLSKEVSQRYLATKLQRDCKKLRAELAKMEVN